MLEHRVIKKETCLDFKLSLDVRLNPNEGEAWKISTGEICWLARHLYKKHKGHKFNKVFICLYLPGMEIDAGAWATAHFTPDLTVNFTGLSNKNEKE